VENNSGFYAPLEYSAWFLWAGLGTLLLIAAWRLFVFLSTRQRAALANHAGSTPPSDPDGLRRDYLRRIDAVVAGAAAGRLSARASHQELSLLIRRFVRDTSGINAPRMTLAELRQQGIPVAAEAISSIYPAEFAREPQALVAATAETAREVIRSWN
jgi:hypothetical protein